MEKSQNIGTKSAFTPKNNCIICNCIMHFLCNDWMGNQNAIGCYVWMA